MSALNPERSRGRREADRFYEAVLGAISDASITVWDVNGRVVYCNTVMERLMAIPPGSWAGQTDTELGMAAEHVDLLARLRRQVFNSGASVSGEVLGAGASRDVSLEYTVSPLHAPGGDVTHVVGVARDRTSRIREMSELRAAQSQIRGLFQRLLSVQEDERRRIARDIHDELGQQLTALRMNLEVVRRQSSGDSAQLRQLERTQHLADEMDRNVDFLTWQLRPPALDQLGLAPALKSLVSSWSHQSGIAGHFHSKGADRVDVSEEAAINLYRLVQEALHNVLKHAKAANATVTVERRDQDLLLVVEDNGIGFEIVARGDSGHSGALGLIGMRERAELVGGQCHIDSAPGRGTTVIVRVPLAAGRLRF
jgi:signal transduction histidine kinase